MRIWLSSAVALAVAAVVAAAALGAFTDVDRSAAGTPDGITVRGDWKIAIKSPSGRVVRVHRFHNEFNGAGTIAPILAHSAATGRYWLTLFSSATTDNPCGSAMQSACFDFEPDDPNAGTAGWFGNLAVTAPSGTLVVAGEVVATRTGQFDNVRMLLSRCAATTAPSGCQPGAYGQFSTRTLPAPITLVAGQQALVTVTYTFAAA
jgi:hypothetical protein